MEPTAPILALATCRERDRCATSSGNPPGSLEKRERLAPLPFSWLVLHTMLLKPLLGFGHGFVGLVSLLVLLFEFLVESLGLVRE